MKYAYDPADTAALMRGMVGHVYATWVSLACLGLVAVMMFLGAFAATVGATLVGEADTPTSVFAVAGAAVGWLLSRPMLQNLNDWAIGRLPGVRRLAGKEITCEISSEALRYECGGVETVVPWSAVDKVFEERGAICAVVALTAYAIPARAFSAGSDRKAMVTAILSYLSPEARARSFIPSQ